MKNIDWKDVLIRSAKTFVEAFLTFVSAEMAGVDVFAVDKSAWFAVGVSAAIAGVCAVWNGIFQPLVKGFLPAKN